MYNKFEINQTKIKGGCQSGRKVVTHHSKSDLPLKHESGPPEQASPTFGSNGNEIFFRPGFSGGCAQCE